MSNTIKILIAEDSKLTVVGLKSMLSAVKDFKIIDTVYDGKAAIEKTLSLKPDIVLMDIGLPLIDGIEATKRIKQADNLIKIIILTSHNSEEDVIEAIIAGANSYCMKDIDPSEMENVIKTTFNGASWFDPQIAGIVLAEIASKSLKPEKNLLTEREEEVLRLIGKGYSNQQISQELFISLNTVKTHLKNIFSKLEVEDRTQAALMAVKTMIIE